MSVIQMGPILYVQNKTNEDLENIFFTLDDYDKEDPRIKKIKSGQTNTTSICNRISFNKSILENPSKFGFAEFKQGYQSGSKTKTLYLYHYDRNNEKRQYIVCDKLRSNDFSNIKVVVSKINTDGSLVFDVILNYDPLKTH